MPSFVLVHGAVHGAWCWERVIPHLLASPHTGPVLAVDLPGRGRRADDGPQDEIGLDDFVAALVGDIEAADLRDIVLVGHSLAGITIPRVAARLPDRIRRIVYLASVHPAPGASVADVITKHPLSPVVRDIGTEEMFCNDLDDEATAWLLGNLGDEPRGPMQEALHPVALELAERPVYVLCERDAALPPELQREQARNAGAEVVPFDSGHSAFASKPRELAELLIRLA